jgi:hypothetical protein
MLITLLTWSLTVREEHKLRVKNGVFWDVTPCGSCKNRRFGGTCRLLVAACVVPSSPILVTLMKEALGSSENVSSYKSHTA